MKAVLGKRAHPMGRPASRGDHPAIFARRQAHGQEGRPGCGRGGFTPISGHQLGRSGADRAAQSGSDSSRAPPQRLLARAPSRFSVPQRGQSGPPAAEAASAGIAPAARRVEFSQMGVAGPRYFQTARDRRGGGRRTANGGASFRAVSRPEWGAPGDWWWKPMQVSLRGNG